jgi:hypothetical protein
MRDRPAYRGHRECQQKKPNRLLAQAHA